MIKKERLQELIEQGATIYVVNNKVVFEEKLNKHHTHDVLKDFFCWWSIPRKRWFFKDLFENQEEAEWVAKMHTERTEKFEPPTWKEFLATKKHEDMFAHWFCGDIHIVMVEENDKKGILKTHNQFEVDIYCDGDSKLERFDYFNNYGIDTREETYYKAVEYARKLFLGVEDE